MAGVYVVSRNSTAERVCVFAFAVQLPFSFHPMKFAYVDNKSLAPGEERQVFGHLGSVKFWAIRSPTGDEQQDIEMMDRVKAALRIVSVVTSASKLGITIGTAGLGEFLIPVKVAAASLKWSAEAALDCFIDCVMAVVADAPTDMVTQTTSTGFVDVLRNAVKNFITCKGARWESANLARVTCSITYGVLSSRLLHVTEEEDADEQGTKKLKWWKPNAWDLGQRKWIAPIQWVIDGLT